LKTASALIRNFVVLFFGNVLGQVLFLIGMILLARRVGPVAFGWWSFAQTLALYLLRAGEFGLEVTGIRAVAQDEAITQQRVGEVVVLRTILALLLVVLVALALGLQLVPSEALMLVAMFSLAVFPVGITVEWLYEAKQRITVISVARILKGVLFFTLIILFVHEPADVTISAAAYVVSLALPSIWLFVETRRRFHIRHFHLTAGRARELLAEAWPIAVATLLSQYSLFFGTTFLGYRASGEEVGLYSAAHRLIIFVWAYGITTAHRVLLPSFAQSHQVSSADFQSRLLSTVRLTVLIALPLGVIGSLVAAAIVRVLYGVGYEAAGHVLAIVLWALVIGMLRSPFDVGLLASARQSVYMKGMVILGLSHTVLNSVGYSVGGLNGLALGVVGAEFIYAVYLAFQHERSFLVRVLRLALKPLAASVLTAMVLFMLPLPWELTVLIGFIVYAAVLAGVGEFSRDDWNLVKEFLGLSREQ